MDITIIGADALVNNISKRVGRDKVNHRIKKRTSDVQLEAKRLARVDTGFMRDSIVIDLWPERLTGAVTAGAEYSPYWEYGTRFMDGKPFMRPARNKVAPLFISDMRNLMRG